jgi:HAD superfamily hydrolase (TIGR01450 family)
VADAVARLRQAGARPLFVTNMSRLTVAEQEAKLARHGIDATGAVITSATAVGRLIRSGERVLVVGGPGVYEAVSAAGAEAVSAAAVSAANAGAIDAVVVGMDPSFDYGQLTRAAAAVRGGARLLATNTDATYPTPGGLLPGAGAVLAAVETASGVRAEVAGKPAAPVVELIRERLGLDGIVAGDRADTDGLLAMRLGYRFGLVLSGVTAPSDLPVEPAPDRVAADLATLVDSYL